eukprot:4529323-Prymnesium_polylepis.1
MAILADIQRFCERERPQAAHLTSRRLGILGVMPPSIPRSLPATLHKEGSKCVSYSKHGKWIMASIRVGHVGWNKGSPVNVACNQGVEDGIDRIESERAGGALVDTAEQVHTGGYRVGRVGWSASSPDTLYAALGQGIADRVDGIERERSRV